MCQYVRFDANNARRRRTSCAALQVVLELGESRDARAPL